MLFFGNGAAKFQSLLGNSPMLVSWEESSLPPFQWGSLAVAAFHRQEFQDVAYYEPFYLKEVYTTHRRKQNVAVDS